MSINSMTDEALRLSTPAPRAPFPEAAFAADPAGTTSKENSASSVIGIEEYAGYTKRLARWAFAMLIVFCADLANAQPPCRFNASTFSFAGATELDQAKCLLTPVLIKGDFGRPVTVQSAHT